eukprot:CAMPEP_0198601494 /NCGR_PEP_ID=MMETSP1462-20131121/149590_1 /TAXON_ID=1333877 /ORGANISM="Brandtodinium nutriculum, Strain RCC3387" /LENGTH=136 /DNA_ID=CAMNT_0044333227 /DNA_START=175 /DNA_END=582 /DNA_ORIENTATION=-
MSLLISGTVFSTASRPASAMSRATASTRRCVSAFVNLSCHAERMADSTTVDVCATTVRFKSSSIWTHSAPVLLSTEAMPSKWASKVARFSSAVSSEILAIAPAIVVALALSLILAPKNLALAPEPEARKKSAGIIE